jgi:hypothetical protein
MLKCYTCSGITRSNPEKWIDKLFKELIPVSGVKDEGPRRRKSQECINELFTVTGNWGSFLLETLLGYMWKGCHNFRSNSQLIPSLKAACHSITHSLWPQQSGRKLRSGKFQMTMPYSHPIHSYYWHCPMIHLTIALPCTTEGFYKYMNLHAVKTNKTT